MRKYCKILISLFVLINAVNGDYWTNRERLIQAEVSQTIGASVALTDKEELVNDFLMARKRKEFDEGFANPVSFIPSRHIFDTLEAIEKSEVFQFVRKLPKGSLLHGHDLGLISGDYLYNLTFSDDLYACVNNNNQVQLKFLRNSITTNNCSYQPIQEMRNTYDGFDELLRGQLTLIRDDYRDVYTDINIVWRYFELAFDTVLPLLTYKPMFEAYFYEILQELHEDNVFYMEFRSSLPHLYDLDGNVYGELETVHMYKEITDKFVMEHENFLGAKLIYAPTRQADNETMEKYIEIVRDLQANLPDFVAGFDLVAQEDLGRPLIDFMDHLLEIKNETNFFFHAGETNWFGSTTDDNLIDAVLLGTLRIGHGYAGLKRPEVLKLVKEEGIAIEICPISNQVLLLTDDLRNHPANYLIANNYPVVISNDGASFWGTKALSYDWYMAFMGMTSRRTDLKFLKQLAVNSIQYSVYDDKRSALKIWQQKWDEFIDSYVEYIYAKNALDIISVIMRGGDL